MTDLPFTLHHVIEAATNRAVQKTAGNPATTTHAMIRLYVEQDVQAWISQHWQPKPTACSAPNAQYPDAYNDGQHQYPCILPVGHEPIAPTIGRTHIDRDGDTW